MTSEPVSLDRRCLLLIPLAACIAVLPLIVHGCSCGHDFDFHLLNWMEAARQFSQGNLHPHWAFSPAFNAGEPRFVFYPPLSWTLGALLGLLLTHLPKMTQAEGWIAAPILFTWIALTASGLTMHRFARAFVSENVALIAASLYLANPYMLFTAYERTAYAELLAASWIPLLLHSILRERVTIKRIALPVALLWLTNVPAAIIGSYTLASLATIRLISTYRSTDPPGRKSSLQLALRAFAGTALGLGLAAFYILPAAYERHFVQIVMATIAGMRIDHNFLLAHTGSSPDDLLHDQVLHAASIVAVLLLATTAVALALVFLRRKQSGFPALPLAILTASIALLLTPWSMPIWRHAPEAAYLQFPWRLLVIVTPIFALAVARALALSFASWRGVGLSAQVAAVIFLATALTLPAYHLFRQPCDPEDTASARLALFQSNAGADPTDEYTPVTADNDALKPSNPPYWLADSSTNSAPAATQPGPAPMHLTVTAPHAEELVLDLREYPAWRITLNGESTPHSAQRPDGLIVVPIAAGTSTIDIRYAHTLDQTLADAITLLALAIYLFPPRARRLSYTR
jgi:hypothetical protein